MRGEEGTCRAVVLIPTWTRPDVAARAAAAVWEQLGPSDLLMVVAQGSKEEIEATRRALADALGPQGGGLPEGVRFERQPEPDRCRARNRALTRTGCRYAVFLDDDSIPRAGWLDALLAPLEEGTADLVAGRLVEEPDRTWLALAAYNVGLGHLRDAQGLARQMGLNPCLWQDLKQVLPFLAKKEYYKNLTYGYARGYEPVRYVQRIREYRHILRNELASLEGEDQ